MSNYPDDFNQKAFDRHMGGEVPRHLKGDLQAVVNATDALTESIRAVKDIAYRFGFVLDADDLESVFGVLDELLHDRIRSEVRALDEEGLAHEYDFSTLQCLYRIAGLPESAYRDHMAVRRIVALGTRPIMQNPQTHADRGEAV